MSTLITMVGLRPGAVAATATTLKKKADLDRVILLYTAKTEANAKLLENYLCNNLFLKYVNWHQIAENPLPESDRSAWRVIEKIIKSETISSPVYLDVSPGLNFQVALLSHHLKNNKAIIPIYADYTYLYNLNNNFEKWETEDIGLEKLLNLHNLYWDFSKKQINGGSIILKLKECREIKGRLHGLVKIYSKRESNERQGYDKILGEARRVESIIRTPALLNYLQPILTVLTNDPLIKERLRAYGTKTIKAISEWDKVISEPPGYLTPGTGVNEMAFNEGPVSISGSQHNPKGENKLLVALGSDPSATLIALFTHKPNAAIILVDKSNKWVCAIAERIRELSGAIPVGEIIFWPADHLGNIEEKEKLINDYLNVDKSKWHANITPGTKAQAWAIMQMPNIEPWSLNQSIASAVSLVYNEDIIEKKILPFAYPSILLQAISNGGKLKNDGDINSLSNFLGDLNDPDNWKEKKAFLEKMVGLISKKANENDGMLGLANGWNKDSCMKAATGHILCLEIEPEKKRVLLQPEVNGKKAKPFWVKYDANRKGIWLEEIIAGAFKNAEGKTSRIDDMIIGIKWDWLDKRTHKHQRTELDVIIMWQGHYICVSCKYGMENIEERVLNRWCADIIAEARACFGRFAIPILVRGGIPERDLDKTIKLSLEEWGILDIGLGLLSKQEKIRNLVEEAIKKSSTLPVPGEDQA